jgi:hypothetical protein
MTRIFVSLLLVITTSCVSVVTDPRPIALPTVVLHSDATVQSAVAGAAIREGSPRVALVLGPAEGEWYDAVAAAAGLRGASGPGWLGPDLGVAFLGLDAVGDTTIEITYDGGRFTLQDALYDLGDRRWLDLLALRVETPQQARPLLLALADYVATDVEPDAAVVIAVAVPSGEVGDSVAHMLTPMYRGAPLCGADAGAVEAAGVRLFFGPEARIFCRSAAAEATAAGHRVRAELVLGRRR